MELAIKRLSSASAVAARDMIDTSSAVAVMMAAIRPVRSSRTRRRKNSTASTQPVPASAEGRRKANSLTPNSATDNACNQ